MKAIVYHKYGSPDIHKLEEVKKPTPTDDEGLVKVHAVSVNLSDWEGLRGKPFYARIGWLFKPKNKILGSDIAGRVEPAGKNVKQFQPGDEVFGLKKEVHLSTFHPSSFIPHPLYFPHARAYPRRR